ncbi:hypothetical protein Hanom_Chr16g01476091 [Helianthus anomalus]
MSRESGIWISWPNVFLMKEMRARLCDMCCFLACSSLFALAISCFFHACSRMMLSFSFCSNISINCLCISSCFWITVLIMLSTNNSIFLLDFLFLFFLFTGSSIGSCNLPVSSDEEGLK